MEQYNKPLNVICVHCKEVFKIRPDKCNICGCQTFEPTQAKTKEQGSITWFRCEDQLPPTKNKTELGNYSDKVLISDGLNFNRREFVRTVNETPVGWMGANINGFTPTHWAYCNLPE